MVGPCKRAESVEDVVRVTSDYLAGWSRQELERLPDTCRPGWVRSPQDIELWADRLTAESAKAMLILEDAASTGSPATS
jgi:hypothetical protein